MTARTRRGPVTRAPRTPRTAPPVEEPEPTVPADIAAAVEADLIEGGIAAARELIAAPPVEDEAEIAPAPEDATETAAEPDPAPEGAPAADDPAADTTDGDDDGVEIPLDPGEEVIATATRFEPALGTEEMVPITYFVTSAGRKFGVDPDGWLAVVTGPDMDTILPPAPKPPRASWKEPRG